MTVIDEKPIPLYIQKCSECGSTFTYKKVEVGFGNNLPCPVCGYGLWARFNEFKDEDKIIARIKDIPIMPVPSTDVVEVKHGEWINKRTMQHDGEFYCSVCDFVLDTFMQGVFYNFCPNCGADMRGETNG